MRIYIAGPMRGLPLFNFPAFNAAADSLRANGHDVFNPAERDISDGFDPAKDEALPLSHYMAIDLPEVCRANAVAVLPGWEKSEGARLEVDTARRLGKMFLVFGGAVDPAGPSEVRVTDPTTGGEKGRKLAQFSLLPWKALWEVAELYGWGIVHKKYPARNWEKGYAWSLTWDALHRHLAAWWEGEENDPETGLCHLTAAAWHVLALLTWRRTHPELDDRPGRELSGISGELTA